jgi:hypothetical protein
LERRYHYPTCARMPCMLLYGDSGMGKTMILEKMERQHPSTLDKRRGIKLRPVLTVQMPPSPDERRFYTRILEVLGAPYSIRDQIGALEGRVIHLLKKLGTKLLFIDEVHHLLAGSHREQRRALNLLKFLANELKIVVVVVGTSDAFHPLQTDLQVASRFEPLLIPDGHRCLQVICRGVREAVTPSQSLSFWRTGHDPRAHHAKRRHHRTGDLADRTRG